MKSAVILLLCGLATAQQDEHTKIEATIEENFEEEITNLGTGQPCNSEYGKISSRKYYLKQAQETLDNSASCANFPGIEETSENKMCKDYKKLSATEDDDKDISQEECGKMVLADEECNGGNGWFAQKGGKRCYGCTNTRNRQVQSLWPSNTMTSSLIKSCVLQGEYDKRVQKLADMKKEWEDAVTNMQKCQGDVLNMCQNNSKLDKEEWSYYVGDDMSCKQKKYLSTDVTWSDKYDNAGDSAECLGKDLGAVYTSKQSSRYNNGYEYQCCTKFDSGADVQYEKSSTMELRFNSLKFCAIDPELRLEFLSNFMQLEPTETTEDVSTESIEKSNSTYYLMGGMAGMLLIFSLKFLKKDNKNDEFKQTLL